MERSDMPERFGEMPAENQSILNRWIEMAFRPARTIYDRATSYGLKHEFEKIGFYVTNGEFKGAMQAAGYLPENPYEQNWRFWLRPAEGIDWKLVAEFLRACLPVKECKLHQ